MNLTNKIIVITGASKGLGKETALRLCNHHSDLILIARNKNRLEQVQIEIETRTGKKPLIIPCDISNEAEVNHMAEIVRQSYNHVDVLINNAGIGVHKIAEKLSNEEMRQQFTVNFFGSFYCIKTLLPLLKKSDSAYILNINSLVSKVSTADNSVYAATKSALAGFSEGLRRELKKMKIRVGLFFPGILETGFQHDREDTGKIPSFMMLNPAKAAAKLEKMIIKRKKESYMYRWMLLIMKVKQLFM